MASHIHYNYPITIMVTDNLIQPSDEVSCLWFVFVGRGRVIVVAIGF
jgi:hypothetical protein